MNRIQSPQDPLLRRLCTGFFVGKVNLPTEAWTDIWHSQHDVAFVVAGAAEAGLLKDLRASVHQAISQGTTLEAFREAFDQIVARHAWRYKGARDWRTQVIYDTNLNTSYAAGRWQQAQAMKAARPYWRYRHSHPSAAPSEQHQAWDNLVLHADDPWWHTHWPPNGWYCQCHVEALTEADMKRQNLEVGKAPPLEHREVVIRRRGRLVRRESVPQGIDPGFGYAPGRAALDPVRRRKILETLPEPLEPASKRLLDEVMGNLPPQPASIAQELARPARMKQELSNWMASKNKDLDAAFPLALIPEKLAATLPKLARASENITDLGRLATLTRGQLKHAMRELKTNKGAALDAEDLLRLPEIIANPEQVLEDTQHPDIWLFIFTPANRLDKKGKLAIRTQFEDDLHFGLHPRNKFISHSFRTSGYVNSGDLNQRRYKPIFKEGE